MASTNKTTNYELSQFIGTDKPAWLSDYNSDMSKIDTGVHTAQTTATSADGKADSNATSIGTLANLTTTAKTDLVSSINEVVSAVTTAQSTANSASNTASSAASAIAKLNFSQFKQYVANEITRTGVSELSLDSLGVASNADGSVGKIYGTIILKCNSTNGFTISFPSTLRPNENIAINGVVWASREATSLSEVGDVSMIASTINVATDGTISVTKGGAYNNKSVRLNFVACLLFMSNFGDQPTE